MNKISIAAVIALATAALAPAAQAADGTIEFTGAVTSVTCVINGGTKDLTVVLPTVSTDALAVAGSEAGRTPFTIELTGCDPGTGKVSTFFESDDHVDMLTGNLNVDDGGATKVQIGLLNDAHEKIKVGATVGQQNSQQVTVSTGGEATLNYYAQYESLGETTSGEVKSRVRYSISYE